MNKIENLVPATMRELKKLKGIIYLIYNSVNHKCYVGLSVRRFIQRYRGCRWWIKSRNEYLKNAANKYGFVNFKIFILAKDISTEEELNKLEKEFAIKYNCYHPNGYNLIECGGGKKFCKATKRKQSKTRQRNLNKKYTLLDINNVSYTTTNLKRFSEVKGIHYSRLSEIANRRRPQYKGWHLPDIDLTMKNKNFPRSFIWEVKDVNGTIYRFTNVVVFCKQQNISYRPFRKMLFGILPYFNKFTLLNSNIEIPNCAITPPKEKLRYENITLEKDNKVYFVTNLVDFSKEIGVCPASVYMLASGEIHDVKGYTLKSVKLLHKPSGCTPISILPSIS